MPGPSPALPPSRGVALPTSESPAPARWPGASPTDPPGPPGGPPGPPLDTRPPVALDPHPVEASCTGLPPGPPPGPRSPPPGPAIPRPGTLPGPGPSPGPALHGEDLAIRTVRPPPGPCSAVRKMVPRGPPPPAPPGARLGPLDREATRTGCPPPVPPPGLPLPDGRPAAETPGPPPPRGPAGDTFATIAPWPPDPRLEPGASMGAPARPVRPLRVPGLPLVEMPGPPVVGGPLRATDTGATTPPGSSPGRPAGACCGPPGVPDAAGEPPAPIVGAALATSTSLVVGGVWRAGPGEPDMMTPPGAPTCVGAATVGGTPGSSGRLTGCAAGPSGLDQAPSALLGVAAGAGPSGSISGWVLASIGSPVAAGAGGAAGSAEGGAAGAAGPPISTRVGRITTGSAELTLSCVGFWATAAAGAGGSTSSTGVDFTSTGGGGGSGRGATGSGSGAGSGSCSSGFDGGSGACSSGVVTSATCVGLRAARRRRTLLRT